MMTSTQYPSGFGLGVLAAMMMVAGLSPTELRAEEFREFTNSSGKTIKAAVISATATDVTLKTEDGRQVSGGISFFSESDRQFIETWRKANPSEIVHEFEITVSKERTARDKVREGNKIIVYESWKYGIKVENRSKSGSTGVTTGSGLEIRYNLAKTAAARGQQTRYLNEGLAPSGGLLIKGGSAKLGAMEYLRSVSIETDVIPITQSELAPGWYYADGTKDQHDDKLEGIWVQIVEGDTVLFEKKLGSKAAAEAMWVTPKGESTKAN